MLRLATLLCAKRPLAEWPFGPGRMAESPFHQALNDVVCRAFISAGIPASKEPAGPCTLDGKRPDGLSLIP